MTIATVNGLDRATGVQQAGITPGNDVTHLRSEFLQMMVAQINNQDPLNPLDGTEYVSQLAQFSMVEGIEQMKMQGQQQATLLDTLQVLSSTSLMGKKVSVPTQSITLDEPEALSGKIAVPAGTELLTMKVYDQNGTLVHEQDWSNPSGEQAFNLPQLASGEYDFKVTAEQEGKSVALAPMLTRIVDKVSLPGGGGDIMLSIAGIGKVSLFQVTEFSQP